MRFIVTLVLGIAACAAMAADKYPAAAIPASLTKNANAVKRAEVLEFQVHSAKSATYTHRYAITILNENGDRHAWFSEQYNKLYKIESVDGALYDSQGKLLKKIKTKDCHDRSAVDDISLIDDNRIKYHNFFYKGYPYTVEYEVTLSWNQTFFMPSWRPQDALNMSVEQSTFVVKVPQDYGLRYKMFNYNGQPAQATDKTRKTYTWQVSQLLPFKSEYAAPPFHERTTFVRIGPNEFEFDGYKGNMRTWEDFGKFIYNLNRDRDQLPAPVKQKVAEIAASASTEREKVEKLYRFLQQNTRYISIQLGIGGYQPFEASFVSKKGYGDCKALSNYMYSLLKEAGIPSNYVLVQSGDYSMMEDFPASQFNHAILCVPLQQDTIWLECTSQSKPAGYMGAATGNRRALLISEGGGKLVATPRYGIRENTMHRSIRGTVDGEGNLHMTVHAVYQGNQQDQVNGMIEGMSKDKVKEYLEETIELSTFEINDFRYDQVKSVLPKVEEHLDILVRNYATITGRRLFIVPNILTKGGMQLTESPDRKVDFVFDYEFRNEDEQEITIPDGYEVEALPKDVSLDTKYGAYFSSVTVRGNKLVYKRIRSQLSGRFPASEQGDIIRFFQEIYKADRAKVVLVKK
ncbi:MAG TPA: DUF3857 and transglutaminase domain-containing protein [Flavisolibacter sp.]